MPNNKGEQGKPDGALQSVAGPMINANPGVRFPGVGANGSAPPDTNMAVGPNHIVQTVNSNYAIYDKSGALLVGPNGLSTLWAPLGTSNGCATNNGGDVVAQYDKLADRWVITQLGGTSAPYSECMAVSTSSDPTGTYFLYSYNYGTTLNDYPKFGVWPTTTNSAYLASYNMFANGSTFTGVQLCAYDRAKMLTGASAQGICYNISNDAGFLPSDLDGATAPLDGTPGYFLNFETGSTLRMYTLQPNFTTPSASTLTQVSTDLAVAAFSQACGGGTCIPQSGTTQQLDSLGDRLMYRLAFRNFGDHEALVVNHSVTAGSSVGVRWYELRSPVSANGRFSVYQQGTFAPDATSRWMGSVAMDKSGNIGLGYSASSSAIHPALRYTGRVPGDPLGTMEAESSIVEGSGSQTGGLSRWGDYSAMRIDASDDCTFWYTNEYLQSNGSFNWSTAFGSFKFASCGAVTTPDFSMSANPTSLTLTQGQSGTSTVTVSSLNGFNSAVALTISGCPSTATCSVAPTSVNGSGTATLTVTTTASTTPASSTLTITGTGPNSSHTASVALTVTAPPPPPPDFTMSAGQPTMTVVRGSNGSDVITIHASTGSNSVNLSVSGLPSRATAAFSVNPVSATAPGSGSSTLTITVSRKASTGTYPLTITGNNGSTKPQTVSVMLTVN